jgi:hypothetical protein
MYTDKILNTAYSFAAAIVVFGAWAKLENKDFGDLALTVGLLVESSIFLIYGLVEWRRRPHSSDAGERQPLAQQSPDLSPTPRGDLNELTQTMRQINRILTRIFRAD